MHLLPSTVKFLPTPSRLNSQRRHMFKFANMFLYCIYLAIMFSALHISTAAVDYDCPALGIPTVILDAKVPGGSSVEFFIPLFKSCDAQDEPFPLQSGNFIAMSGINGVLTDNAYDRRCCCVRVGSELLQVYDRCRDRG